MLIEVLSLFPEYIKGPLAESILKRAITAGLLEISSVDIRSFSERLDKRVDDRPYGGGPGMVMMAEPILKAIRHHRTPQAKVICLSPQGQQLTPKIARELSKYSHLILLSGHYEGIDQRVLDSEIDMELSIGDYVLTNGCLAALVVIDALARFIPGVLGAEDGATYDSFENGIFDHSHYTRPFEYEGREVPEVLLSGDHEKIERWRYSQAFEKTKEKRPELVAEKVFWKSKRNQIAVTSHNFHKSCQLYKRVFSCEPIIESGQASFITDRDAFTLFYSESTFLDQTMLKFICSEEAIRKVVRYVRKIGEDSLLFFSKEKVLFRDPDGRILQLEKI